MGSLNLFLPFTYLVFLFGSLSLMAFPFTSGWYSKDLIIELLIVPTNFTHTIAYIFTLLGAFLTSSYSIRVKKKVMLNRPNFPKTILNYVVDSNYLMTLPLLLISIGAITFGYLSHELFLASGSTFYLNSIFIHPATLSATLDAQFGGSLLALLPILFLFLITILFFITPKSST
jgi:NADH-ubiquinone oxidoreductase chain 5